MGCQSGQKAVSIADLLKIYERVERRGVGTAFVRDTYEMAESNKSTNGALTVDEYEFDSVATAMGSRPLHPLVQILLGGVQLYLSNFSRVLEAHVPSCDGCAIQL